MFVGHYGPSFVAKALKASIPLWVLFLAVQLVDVFWALLVLAGIEKVRIAPGITATNPLDLYFMPYTHSLAATAGWVVAGALVYRALRGPGGWSAAWIVGGAVGSHWFLDLLVHRPDLPLYDDTHKVGLGLWNYPAAALALEAGLLFGAMALYYRVTRATGRGGRIGMVLFGIVMVAAQALVFFGPPPTSDKAIAVTALVSYAVFAGVAVWLERKRVAA
jgi:hypothetical protein